MNKKYGGYTFQSKELLEKVKQTNLERYGVENPSQNKKVQNKRKKTNLERYGVEYPWNQHWVVRNNIDIKKENYYQNLNIKTNCIPLFKINEYNGIKNYYKWKCNDCETMFFDTLYRGKIPLCPTCNVTSSKYERYIIDILSKLKISIDVHNRKIIAPLELDIYLPDYNIAIEFNGLYWHSNLYKEKNYHLNKTKLCEEKGIQLIHIFEDEWIYKKNIVITRLKNILGFNEHRIGARKCTIKEISIKEKNIFLNQYHIQGTDKSTIKIGSYYNNILIGVMTFSRPRIFTNQKKINGAWELSRFATINNTYTPGLASKLLKYFERNYKPQTVFSYADKRWSQGNLYYKIGFEFKYETPPNYWYFNKELIRKHRYTYRKNNLKKFINYSDNKTENQIMYEAGYLKIYDCGNIKFIKNYSNLSR